MAEKVAANKDRVVLGGCKHYIAEHDGKSALSELKSYCVEDNLIGWTQGGTTVNYTYETKTIEDDVGMVRKVFKTKGDASIKTGFLTYALDNIAQMMSVGRFTKGEDGGTHKLELTGGTEELKSYVVVAEYEDKTNGRNLRAGIVATNTEALELVFNKDNETVPNITFTATSNGKDDTILVLEEDVPQASEAV